MKKSLLLFMLVLVVLSGGCRGKKGNTGNAGNLESTTKDGSPVFPQEYSLVGRIHDAELYVKFPEIAYVADSLIVLVSSDIQENFGGIYNTRDNMKKVASFGNIGRGPGEFFNPELTSDSGDQFTIYDKSPRYLSVMEIIDNNGAVGVSMKERHELSNWTPRESMDMANVSRICDNYYVGLAGRSKDEYFALLDDKLSVIKYFGDSPLKDELSNDAIRMSVMVRTPLCAGHGLFAYASYYTRSVTCYKLNGKTMEKAWEDSYAPMYYQIENGQMISDKERMIVGCSDICMTGKYIYLLVNFDTMENAKDENTKSMERDVLVYDHDGNRIAQIHLDNIIREFTVSSDDKKLYGYLHSEDKFISYDLPF